MDRHAVTCCVVLALASTFSCHPVDQDNAIPAKLPVRRSPRSAFPGFHRHVDVADAFSAAFSGSKSGAASSFSKASAVSYSISHRYPILSSLFTNDELHGILPYHHKKYYGLQSKPDTPKKESYEDSTTQETTEEGPNELEQITHYPQKIFLHGLPTTTPFYPMEDHTTTGNYYETTSEALTEFYPPTTTPPPLEETTGDDYPIDPRMPPAVNFGDFFLFKGQMQTGVPEDQAVPVKFPIDGYAVIPVVTEQDPGYVITTNPSADEYDAGDHEPATSVQETNPEEGNYDQIYPINHVSEEDHENTREGVSESLPEGEAEEEFPTEASYPGSEEDNPSRGYMFSTPEEIKKELKEEIRSIILTAF